MDEWMFKEVKNQGSANKSDWHLGDSITWKGDTTLAPTSSSKCDLEKVKELKEKFNKMISKSKAAGQNVAASNLQHFMDGSGSPKEMKVEWLREFDTIFQAESRILNYAKNRNLNTWVNEVKEKGSLYKTDYWDADITNYSMSSELTYASGASDMRGNVSMKLSRAKNIVSISGTVKIKWTDTYDWNKGQGFYIPGVGYVSDSDGLYLEECGGAKSFLMKSNWEFEYSGYYSAKQAKWVSSEWKIDGAAYVPNDDSGDSSSR